MAHEFESGFFVKDAAWHQLGNVLQVAPRTADEILSAGNFGWTVRLQALQGTDGTPIPRGKGRAIIRDTDNRVLGMTGGTYCELQNRTAAEWWEPLIRSGLCTMDGGMSLRHGERIVFVARCGNGKSQADVLPGDAVVRHAFLAHGHDGKVAVTVGTSRTRIVCMNTLRAAMGEGSHVKIRHTASMDDTLTQVREVLQADQAAFEADVGAFQHLARTKVTATQLRSYVKAVFADTFKPAAAYARAKTLPNGTRWTAETARTAVDAARIDAGPAYVAPAGQSLIDDLLGSGPAVVIAEQAAAIAAASDDLISPIYDRIVELVECGRGTDVPGVRGTMWGAYNAVAEHLQYEAGRGPAGYNAARADSMIFGGGATANGIALQKALDFAKYGS